MEGLVIVVAGAGSLVAIVAMSLHAASRRRARLSAWEGAARGVGLGSIQVDSGRFTAGVSGRAGTLEVRLESYSNGPQDGGTRLTIRETRPATPSLSVLREGVASSFEKDFLGTRETVLGDPAFDADCFVLGPRELAMATLTGAVREAVAPLVRGGLLRGGTDGPYRVGAQLSGGVLQIDVRDHLLATHRDLPDVLAAALRIARALQPPPDLAVRLVENLQTETVAGVRVRLVETLVEHFPFHARTREALVAACGDCSDEVRLRAAGALEGEGWATLISLASGENTSDACRARALRLLGSTAGADLVEGALRRAVETRDRETARACLEVVREFRPQAEPVLIAALDVDDDHVVLAAVQALRACGGVDAVARLIVVTRGGGTGRGPAGRARGRAHHPVAPARRGTGTVDAGERWRRCLVHSGTRSRCALRRIAGRS